MRRAAPRDMGGAASWTGSPELGRGAALAAPFFFPGKSLGAERRTVVGIWKGKDEMENDNQDLRRMMRGVIEEFLTSERSRAEPAYKAELVEERRRRESLERRVNELVEENRRSQRRAEETERDAKIRGELARLGVAKVDLAYQVIKEDIVRTEDGRLVARTEEGERGLREYLAGWVKENPEFLPARMAGGSGVAPGGRVNGGGGSGFAIELERIRPGMSAEELQMVRERISQVAKESLRGE